MIKPIHLWLEVTNKCNSNCVFCGREYIDKPCDMDFSLFKKIIDSCSSAETVQTQGIGEPLLYPHIVEAVSYARRSGKKVEFYTNASLLDLDMAQRLLDAKLSKIVFSVDEINGVRYEMLRRGLKWEIVLNNIKRFIKIRDKGGYETEAIVRVTRTKENSSRIQKITKFWKEIVGAVSVMPEIYIPPPDMLRKNPFLSGDPISCHRVWEHLSVKSDGTLILCCQDRFKVYPMGNVGKESVLATFNGKRFMAARWSLVSGKNHPTLCDYCTTPSLR